MLIFTKYELAEVFWEKTSCEKEEQNMEHDLIAALHDTGALLW